jgi:hypothetical protein
MTLSLDRAADCYDNTRTLAPEVSERLTAEILRLGRAAPTPRSLSQESAPGEWCR